MFWIHEYALQKEVIAKKGQQFGQAERKYHFFYSVLALAALVCSSTCFLAVSQLIGSVRFFFGNSAAFGSVFSGNTDTFLWRSCTGGRIISKNGQNGRVKTQLEWYTYSVLDQVEVDAQ